MSVRIEFMGTEAVLANVALAFPDEDWEGAQYQYRPVLIIAANSEITAVEGSLEEIRALGQRIVQLVDQLDSPRTNNEGSNES